MALRPDHDNYNIVVEMIDGQILLAVWMQNLKIFQEFKKYNTEAF